MNIGQKTRIGARRRIRKLWRLIPAVIFLWPLNGTGARDRDPDCRPCRLRLLEIHPAVEAPEATVLITHGLGRLQDGDRFFRLGESVKKQWPECRVVVVDWGDRSNRTALGLPNPWTAADGIRPAGRDLAHVLRSLEALPGTTVMIGESFGVYVNSEAAGHFGPVRLFLGFNPPPETAGFPLPDLTTRASMSRVFVTRSQLDADGLPAHECLFLQTGFEHSDIDCHTSGIPWLRQQLLKREFRWFRAGRLSPGDWPASPSGITAEVTMSGEVVRYGTGRSELDQRQEDPVSLLLQLAARSLPDTARAGCE